MTCLSEVNTWPCPPVMSCLRWVPYPGGQDGLFVWSDDTWPCPPVQSCLWWVPYPGGQNDLFVWSGDTWPCPPVMSSLRWVPYLALVARMACLCEVTTWPCLPVMSCLWWVTYPGGQDGLFVWSDYLTLSAGYVLPVVSNLPWWPGWPVCLKWRYLTLSASYVLPEVSTSPWRPGWPVCLKWRYLTLSAGYVLPEGSTLPWRPGWPVWLKWLPDPVRRLCLAWGEYLTLPWWPGWPVCVKWRYLTLSACYVLPEGSTLWYAGPASLRWIFGPLSVDLAWGDHLTFFFSYMSGKRKITSS